MRTIFPSITRAMLNATVTEVTSILRGDERTEHNFYNSGLPELTGALAEKALRAEFLVNEFLMTKEVAIETKERIRVASEAGRKRLWPQLFGLEAYMRWIIIDFGKEFSICDDGKNFHDRFLLFEGDVVIQCSLQATERGAQFIIAGYGSQSGNLQA